MSTTTSAAEGITDKAWQTSKWVFVGISGESVSFHDQTYAI
jgi:hypothetical protein